MPYITVRLVGGGCFNVFNCAGYKLAIPQDVVYFNDTFISLEYVKSIEICRAPNETEILYQRGEA